MDSQVVLKTGDERYGREKEIKENLRATGYSVVEAVVSPWVQDPRRT